MIPFQSRPVCRRGRLAARPCSPTARCRTTSAVRSLPLRRRSDARVAEHPTLPPPTAPLSRGRRVFIPPRPRLKPPGGHSPVNAAGHLCTHRPTSQNTFGALTNMCIGPNVHLIGHLIQAGLVSVCRPLCRQAHPRVCVRAAAGMWKHARVLCNVFMW